MKRVSIKDVAKSSGVSTTTVSQILNGKGGRFSDQTRDRVFKARDELGYIASIAAKTLKGFHSILIGVIVPSFRLPFFANLIESMEKHEAYGVRLVFFAAADNKIESAIRSLVARGVGGLIIGRSIPESMKIYQLLAKQHIPYLVLDQNSNQQAHDRIIVDEFRGGGLVANHFIGLGHTKLAIVSPQKMTHNMLQRQQGFVEVLAPKNIQPIIINTADLSKHSGYAVTKKVIASKVSAVFVLNDAMSLGLIRGLIDSGLNIPRDISLAGYDDDDYAQFVTPALTTVSQPVTDIGISAIKLLMNRINYPNLPAQIQKFNLTLIKRESTSIYGGTA
ncbi:MULTISPECIES: ribose utilization transcriptional repressor RbsR [Leuconostoc]|uniref:LacI family DNA-binding transcriptional regulator n=1 Tax=Leuconostoc pseudomesenteroides TaxID=33968 RepID=A0A5B8SYA4_LEUPS|nr:MULTISPECIES: LacI family DNA-binding transcriptional regulator [Leuconostoc]MDG9733180.1 LacI family DNA-binding transcriptional regulator [Leuconostoc pseudomesenteroides]MDN2450175.1 LacI family transcriptional regulator [Leuconostoc sp. UCMA20149]NKZ36720.1 LacI family transcriptional regulator [Leuconostoc pseudomesenteroides]QEA41054.1 LacI family transcriptional regulator [Leuconostoc pseudomesenteroides]QQB27129.1 LacI family DNA-binding transcriptional regulator [Leuconostoc pseudo